MLSTHYRQSGSRQAGSRQAGTRQSAINRTVSTTAAEAAIVSALRNEARTRDGYQLSATAGTNDQKRAQEIKERVLKNAHSTISTGGTLNASDIDIIGKYVGNLLPSGSLGNVLDQEDIFGRGNVSRFGGRTGGTNTVDTHEHFRISRELSMLKAEALRVKLDTQERSTEAYRQARNKELIEYNVHMQTLPLAT